MSAERPAAALRRRRADFEALEVAGESLGALRAELVLLREENARLKAAQHRRPTSAGCSAGPARCRPHARTTRRADETTRMLVEGLVIRESLLEICHEIERAMVSFEARLKALEPTGACVAAPALELATLDAAAAATAGRRRGRASC